MAKGKHKTPLAPKLSPDAAKALSDKLDQAIDDYKDGTVDELEQALGMYILGRHMGWKVLVLVHNKRTIRKYEEILGISIREEFEEVGPAADRSMGFRIAKTLSNFWKAVSGETPIENRRRLTDG